MTYDINALETLDYDRDEIATFLVTAGMLYEYQVDEVEDYELEALMTEYKEGIKFGFDY